MGRLLGASPTPARPPAPRGAPSPAPRARAPQPTRPPRAAPGAPTPAPARRGTHLPAQQRQDEPLELPQACVDARAAALLQQRLQALRTGAEAEVTRVAVPVPAPAAPPSLPSSYLAQLRRVPRSPRQPHARRGSGAAAGPACRRPVPARTRSADPGPRGSSARCSSRRRRGATPRQPPGFKEAVSPAPPHPSPRSLAACGSHLPPLFLRRVGEGRGRRSPRGAAPGLRIPSAAGSRAGGAPEPLQGYVWAPSKPWLPRARSACRSSSTSTALRALRLL